MTLRLQPAFWRPLLRRIGRRLFSIAENNGSPGIGRNGELWLLRELLAAHVRAAGQRAFVAFDVGANTGAYTRQILEEARRLHCPVEIHVFEPSPRCLEGLRREFGGETAVRIVGAAASDQRGEATLFAGASGSTLASLVERSMVSTEASGAVRVPLLRLEDYAIEQRIARVDLVKLDVEGAELAALRGGGDWLQPGQVDVVQFEYGGTTLDAGATLKDLCELLTTRGYRLAKLLPRALDVRAYEPWMENFAYANYVALAPRWLAQGGAVGHAK